MKKVIAAICFLCLIAPVFADDELNAKMQKAEQKYQLKVEKIRKKQELKCLKHPEKCQQANVQTTNMTLGVAQKNIKLGTSQDEVAMALGSPNIVTVDSDGKDTWIYDKVSSVTSYSNSGFNVGLGGFGGGGGIGGTSIGGGGGLISAGYGKNGGNVQSNQKTLTIVIKFTDKKVSSFRYHMSNF